MAVSGITSSVGIYIPPATVSKTPKPASPAAAPTTNATAAPTTTTPATATPVPTAAPATASAPAPTPKIDPIKLAIKESSEPISQLTQQAKQGDVVARLILKQINAKTAAKQAQTAKPQTGSLQAAESRKGAQVDRLA